MEANEFIKKYGIDAAKKLLETHEKSYMPDVFDMWSDKLQDFVLATKYSSFEMKDLKHLVESHELVEFYGGLGSAKEIAENKRKTGFEWLAVKIEKAIADVESCQ